MTVHFSPRHLHRVGTFVFFQAGGSHSCARKQRARENNSRHVQQNFPPRSSERVHSDGWSGCAREVAYSWMHLRSRLARHCFVLFCSLELVQKMQNKSNVRQPPAEVLVFAVSHITAHVEVSVVRAGLRMLTRRHRSGEVQYRRHSVATPFKHRPQVLIS